MFTFHRGSPFFAASLAYAWFSTYRSNVYGELGANRNRFAFCLEALIRNSRILQQNDIQFWIFLKILGLQDPDESTYQRVLLIHDIKQPKRLDSNPLQQTTKVLIIILIGVWDIVKVF